MIFIIVAQGSILNCSNANFTISAHQARPILRCGNSLQKFDCMHCMSNCVSSRRGTERETAAIDANTIYNEIFSARIV